MGSTNYASGSIKLFYITRTLIVFCNFHFPCLPFLSALQDWDEAAKAGFKESKLSDQCTHR